MRGLGGGRGDYLEERCNGHLKRRKHLDGFKNPDREKYV